LHIFKTFGKNVRVNCKPKLLQKRMLTRKNSLPLKLQNSLLRLPRRPLRLVRKRLRELEGKHGKLEEKHRKLRSGLWRVWRMS
jgi:hypothetical protein